MTINEGLLDRAIRIAAGCLILFSFFLIDGSLKWLALIGVPLLVTGLVGSCPAYRLFGIRTGP